MSNSWFQFKQFRVEQGDTAMKVSTDACIQGTWTPINASVHNVLDIGTGTGLLSMMLAQRSSQINIDAIELDENAALQAKTNIAASLWENRISVFHSDVKNFAFTRQYDLIICNPPFFQNSLLGPDATRNNARHTVGLNYNDLLEVIVKNLAPDGYASILLPDTEHKVWTSLVNTKSWNIFSELNIHHKPGSEAGRVVSLISKDNLPKHSTDLTIYDTNGAYSTEFAGLLGPFYLHL